MEKFLLVVIKTLYEINGLIEIWVQKLKIITQCKVNCYSFMCLIHYERWERQNISLLLFSIIYLSSQQKIITKPIKLDGIFPKFLQVWLLSKYTYQVQIGNIIYPNLVLSNLHTLMKCIPNPIQNLGNVNYPYPKPNMFWHPHKTIMSRLVMLIKYVNIWFC